MSLLKKLTALGMNGLLLKGPAIGATYFLVRTYLGNFLYRAVNR
jgi:hypothetical protein